MRRRINNSDGIHAHGVHHHGVKSLAAGQSWERKYDETKF